MLVITHGLYINLVVSGMRANELDPYDAGDVLHLYDQTILVAAITFISGGYQGGGDMWTSDEHYGRAAACFRRGEPLVSRRFEAAVLLQFEICVYVYSDIYSEPMSPRDRPLVWLHGKVKTPPFSHEARIEAGYLLRRLQRGDKLALPHSRPMPDVGARCHELRIVDADATWRILYRADPDAIIIVEVFPKKTAQTPQTVINTVKKRLMEYDNA